MTWSCRKLLALPGSVIDEELEGVVIVENPDGVGQSQELLTLHLLVCSPLLLLVLVIDVQFGKEFLALLQILLRVIELVAHLGNLDGNLANARHLLLDGLHEASISLMLAAFNSFAVLALGNDLVHHHRHHLLHLRRICVTRREQTKGCDTHHGEWAVCHHFKEPLTQTLASQNGVRPNSSTAFTTLHTKIHVLKSSIKFTICTSTVVTK